MLEVRKVKVLWSQQVSKSLSWEMGSLGFSIWRSPFTCVAHQLFATTASAALGGYPHIAPTFVTNDL